MRYALLALGTFAALASACYSLPEAQDEETFTHGIGVAGDPNVPSLPQTPTNPNALPPVIGLTATPQDRSNMCLDARSANPNDGDLVQLYPCNGSGAQRWAYIDGQMRIAGNKCLDLPAGETPAKGGHLAMRVCDPNSSTQRWIIDLGIIYADKVGSLQLPSATAEAGALVQLADIDFNDATQKWLISLTTPDPNKTLKTTGFSTTPRTAPDRCLEVAGNGLAMTPCTGAPAQTWTWQISGQLQAGSKCIQLPDTAPSNGTTVGVADCDAVKPTQTWVSAVGHIVNILNSAAYKCLELTPGEGGAAKVVVNDCATTPAQLWDLGALPLPPAKP
jgi:hypothetical protein